jgi:glycosyltransferase involved in cell wall biosynthesis
MNTKSNSSNCKISVLLPTRGRTESLKRSLDSLVDLADSPGSIEILLAFDDDDTASSKWFQDNVTEHLDSAGAKYTAFSFPRLGYLRLNEYINNLARKSQGDWLFFWGDDAIMNTPGWDSKISMIDKFRVLRIPTHNCHPYAIFPIVPRQWFEMFGYMSAHQLTDSWVSQVAYMCDIMQDIEVDVTHDRFDLTGNNNDETFANRPMLEGNPADPRDFNHKNWSMRRMQDAHKIYDYLVSIGDNVPWFGDVLAGKQDPWEKMCSPERDPNQQVKRFR